MNEVWKVINGFEAYKVSNYGRVYSTKTLRLLKPLKHTRGYLQVQLGRKNKLLVHRLVAEAFLPNDSNKPFINHIDGNKANNCVSNLEWVTQYENMQHASTAGLLTTRAIEQLDTNGNVIGTFGSIAEAQAALGHPGKTNIGYCLQGHTHTAYGYGWRYKLGCDL